MTVIEDATDKHGTPCFVFKSTNLKLINEWLFFNYNGYKFAIIADTLNAEFEEFAETYVYFLDVAMREAVAYAGRAITEKAMKSAGLMEEQK